MKILLYDRGLPFNLSTPYSEPLGGSEMTLLLLARGLSELGHEVVLLNSSNYKEQQQNFELNNAAYFDYYARWSEVIILNRSVPEGIAGYWDKKTFYFTHDAYDQSHIIGWLMNYGAEYHFHKVICVSEWQKRTFVDYLGLNPEQLVVLGNPIDYFLYKEDFSRSRNENKLVFAGIPYKGLEIVPDLFESIQAQSGDNISLDVYSSFELYQAKQADQRYVNTYRRLEYMEGVKLHKPVSMKKLAEVFKGASLYLAPSLYHETFGRLYVEAMAGGCLPVVPDNGANREIVVDGGYVTNYPNIHHPEAFEDFVKTATALLKRDLNKERNRAERNMKKWDYKELAKELEKIINT